MKLILPPRLTVNILLFEAYSNMLLACLLEPLRVVRDAARADITWKILTHGDRPLRSSSGLTITPDMPLAKARPCDLLLVIGGDHFRRDATDPALRRSLRLVRQAGAVVAADTGAWLLAKAGYLDGRRATLHWQLLAEFSETFTDVVAVHAPYVRDGRWTTCGSAAAALEVILQDVAHRFGPAARFDAATMFLNDPSYPAGAEIALAVPHPHAKVRQIVGLMAAHVEKPLRLPRLARRGGITLRSLARLFEIELNMSPGRYYLNLRLARARELTLQSGLSKSDIALRCGFSSASALARAYRRLSGQPSFTSSPKAAADRSRSKGIAR
jgi:AraC family transcriptional regulator, glycine betaine-responsive activator